MFSSPYTVSKSAHQTQAESTIAQVHDTEEAAMRRNLGTINNDHTSSVITDSESRAPTDGQGRPSLESTCASGGPSLSDRESPSSAKGLPDSIKKLQLEDSLGDTSMDSLDKEGDLADHRLHSLDVSIGCDMCKESRDILSLLNETTDTENNDDIETRSRMWSFEQFLMSISPEQKQEQNEAKDSLSLDHKDATAFSLNKEKLRHRKGKNCSDKTSDGSGSKGSGGKKKGKSSSATMYNGRVVLYYGMGAGSFGL